MRVRIGKYEVDGTVEEVAQLLALVERSPSPPAIAHVSTSPAASPFVTEAAAVDVLTRRELGESQAVLLKLLNEAGETWTGAPELQRELGMTTREFAGLLGAFGKRLSNTESVGSRRFFDQYWDAEAGYNLYRLPPSVRRALAKAGLAE